MDPSPARLRPFQIGAWRVEPRLNRMVGPPGQVQIEPRVMAVLCCLAEHAGAVVPRETLHATVWADVVVGDDPLNRAVSTLRKHFGDDPRAPTHIETIRSVGYRLIAPVTEGTMPNASLAARGDAVDHVVVPTVPTAPTLQAASPVAAERAAALPPTGVSESEEDARALRPMWLGMAALAGAVVLALAIWGGLARPGDETAALRPTPLTSLPGLELDPALSPDGSRVAYVWNSGAGRAFDLYVRTLEEAPPLRLTEGPTEDRSPAWSPSGQALAFVRHDGGACSILRVPVLGGSPRHLAGCTEAQDLAWGPSGLVFSDRSEPGGPLRLYLLRSDAARPEPFTTPAEASAGDHSPAFAPGGRHLAFVRTSVSGLDRVFTIPLAGGAPNPRTSEPQRLSSLAWPESDALVYASDRAGGFALYRHDLRSEAVRWLASGGDGVHQPSGHGGSLIYEERTWDKNVWAYPLGGGAPKPFGASTRWDHSPDVAADGRVAFVSNRSGSYELWLSTPAVGDSADDSDDDYANRFEMLTDFGGPVIARPRWSPDGQRLAFDARTGSRSTIYLLDPATRAPQRLTSGPANAIHATWSPDGQTLFFASDDGGAWQIWRMPSAGGDAERVTDNGGYLAAADPSGRWLYYTKLGTDALWRKPLAGGSEARVTDALRAADYANWTVTARGVYLVTRGAAAERDHEAAPILSHLDPDTGGLTSVGRPSRPVANLGLALHGDHLLYVQVDRQEADLMLLRAEE